MTNKQIKELARAKLSKCSGSFISLMIYNTAILTFVITVEAAIYLILKWVGWQELFDIRKISSDIHVCLFWVIQFVVVILLLSPEISCIRRFYIDTCNDRNFVVTRQFILSDFHKFYKSFVKAELVQLFIKFVTLVPGLISAFGIYYWGYICRLETLTSLGLFLFMLCLGFTIIWAGAYIHYNMSLCLTPYIMAYNPRTNIFDACDLSVRLMEGKHSRLVSFYLSWLKFLPLMLLIYPYFAIYPYYKISYIILMDEFLGDFKRDKLPSMIKRWRKYRQ